MRRTGGSIEGGNIPEQCAGIYRDTFEQRTGEEEYSSSLSRGGYTLSGRYAIDSERSVIYLIPDDAETEDDVEEVIFDYDPVSGDIDLMFKGVQLQQVE